MQSRFKILLLITSCVLLVCNDVGYCEQKIDKELEKIFFKEAPKKWNEYLLAQNSCKGHIKEELIRSSYSMNKYPSLKNELVEMEFVVSFPNLICETKYEGGMRVDGSNANYYFLLENEKKDNNWIISSIEKNDSFSSAPKMEFPDRRKDNWHKFSKGTANYTSQGLFLVREWLPILVHTKEFKILELEQVFEEQTRLVRLKYEYEPIEDPESITLAIRSGEIFLLPDSYWIVKRGKCYFSSPTDINGRFSITWENGYSLSNNQLPLLNKRDDYCCLSDVNETKTWTRVTLYDLAEISDTPPPRFMLSHYGLPEPDFGDRRPNRIRYIIMGIGLLMIGIGAWRMIQKRRENA